jgi:hypothetical protein
VCALSDEAAPGGFDCTFESLHFLPKTKTQPNGWIFVFGKGTVF